MSDDPRPGELRIIRADLDDPRIIALIETHATRARAATDRCSAHALDVADLEAPSITVYAAWRDGIPLAVGALKRLSADDGEIKSMYTAPQARRGGVGRAMLDHLLAAARADGLRQVSLETGAMAYFEAARALYRSRGFIECQPFGDYREDPNSVYLTRLL